MNSLNLSFGFILIEIENDVEGDRVVGKEIEHGFNIICLIFSESHFYQMNQTHSCICM